MGGVLSVDRAKMKVGVILGGTSSEREVSISSGKAVSKALKSKGYNVVEIDAADSSFLDELKGIDVAFVILHGKPGEDGVIQGVLEYMGIPYTGPGVLAAAVSMNKLITKKVLAYHGLRVPDYRVLRKKDFSLPGEKLDIGFPLVVKPVDEGSTIGVSLVMDDKELQQAVDKAFSYSDEVLVEEYIKGRELTVGVVGDMALPVIEIKPKKGFYDYESKYTKGMTEYIVPAELDKDLSSEAQQWAVIAHRALYQRGVSRTDFRLSEDGRLYVLEINSIPGMTETSLLPKAAACVGISFEDLVEKILLSAFE